MANFHDIFLRYNEAISLSKSRIVRLRSARKAIENTIKREFKTNKNLEIPRFWIQGSVKMETLVVKKDNTYDVDLGVYFVNTKGFTAKTLQDNIVRAVKKLQTWHRMWICVNIFNVTIAHIVKVQRIWRKTCCRANYIHARQCVIIVQSCFRRARQKNVFGKKKWARKDTSTTTTLYTSVCWLLCVKIMSLFSRI